MKFIVLAVLALASVASAVPDFGRGTLVFGGDSTYNLRLPKVDQSLTRGAAVVSAAPATQYVAVQAVQPVQQVRYVQAVQQPVQYVQVQAAPAVQYVQAVAAPARAASGPITAAVQSTYNLKVVDVPSSGSVASPQTIVIGPSVQPLDFEFQSQSSPISVRQTHIPGQPNAPQFSSHQDEPDILKQEIVKPIVHEVTEAIQPFRKITQEVRPVQETINQVITRGQQVQKVVAAAVQAAPVQTVAVQAAPVQTLAVQAAPVQTVAVQAAPVQTVAVQAAPVTTAQVIPVSVQSGLTGLTGLSGLSGISTVELVDGSSSGFGLTGSLQTIRKKK